jgi:hypothetical protein
MILVFHWLITIGDFEMSVIVVGANLKWLW